MSPALYCRGDSNTPRGGLETNQQFVSFIMLTECDVF